MNTLNNHETLYAPISQVEQNSMLDSLPGVCTSSWRECHRFLSSELPTRPKAELRTDVLHGKPVRVTITKDTYTESFLLDNVNMNAAVICGEVIAICYSSCLEVHLSYWGGGGG